MIKVSRATYETKALSISLLLHVSVVVFYFFYIHYYHVETLPSKTVIMEITTIEQPVPPQQVAEPTSPKPLQKIQEQVVSKAPTPKPIIKQKRVIKQEVTRPVEEVVASTTVKSTQPMQPLVETTSTSTPQTLSSAPLESYEQTDFEIIRDKVLSALIYPSVAKRMRWTGIVQVALVIDTSGYLLSATIHQSSGKDILDNAALEAAHRLKGQLLPKPKSTSTVILPIAFKLR